MSFRFHRDGGFHGCFRDAQAKLELSDAVLAGELGLPVERLIEWKAGTGEYPVLPDPTGRLLILFGCGLADLADVIGADGPADRWDRLEAEELRLLAVNAGYQPADWSP